MINQNRHIGCCGAYCKTCRTFNEGLCTGCKMGFVSKNSDIDETECPIEVCCFKEKKLETCADCKDFSECKMISDFHSKKGYKYKKLKQAIEFINKNGEYQ